MNTNDERRAPTRIDWLLAAVFAASGGYSLVRADYGPAIIFISLAIATLVLLLPRSRAKVYATYALIGIAVVALVAWILLTWGR